MKNSREQDLNIHGILPDTTVNGPGRRCLIMLQGCDRNCPDCFNPDTHPFEMRTVFSPHELFKRVAALEWIKGITVSGGEPVLQIRPLITFLKLVTEKSPLSVVLFRGLTLDAIENRPFGPQLLALLDILIDGPFVREMTANNSLRGSSNQKICFLSGRYGFDDIKTDADSEIIIKPGGEILITGFNDFRDCGK